MTYKVRLWVENEVVKCCSGVCTEQSCPRVGDCKETEIEEVEEYDDYSDTLPCGCCACCGCSCDDERDEE